jgi:hypothetical protein
MVYDALVQSSLRLSFLFIPVLVLGCAKGAQLGNVGGAGGFGGAGQVTNANGPGTTNNGNTSNNVGPTTNNGPTTDASNTTDATNGPTTDATTTNAATTAVASTTQQATVATVGPATTSSGPTNCDPENPGSGCGANQHCVAQPAGSPVCQPAGSGFDYDPCTTRASCQPQDECANGGGGGCCLAWCNVNFNDCLSGFDTCTPLNPPVYVNGVEYGVCYDGISPC